MITEKLNYGVNVGATGLMSASAQAEQQTDIQGEDLPEWMPKSLKFYHRLVDGKEAAVYTNLEMLKVRGIANGLLVDGETEVSKRLHSIADKVEKYNDDIYHWLDELVEMKELVHEPNEVGELSGDQIKKHLTYSEKSRKLLDELEKWAFVKGRLSGLLIGLLIGGLCPSIFGFG